jgi:hypothetical protein
VKVCLIFPGGENEKNIIWYLYNFWVVLDRKFIRATL